MGELSISLSSEKKDNFTPYFIGDYLLTQPMTSNKSGFSKWGFCTRGGKEYFIKEFLNPVYPLESIKLEPDVRQRKMDQCIEWFNQKKRIYFSIAASQAGNLVPPLELFRNESHFYLVTDKVSETPMDTHELSSIDMDNKFIMMKVLANSFSKLADNNVVHADLKLDNLMIKQTNGCFFTIKVIDFDASYLQDSAPVGEEIQGDFVYLAPETFLAMIEEPAVLSPKVDVFAMGIVFHQLLCGELPGFDSDYDYVYEAGLNDAELKISEDIPEEFRSLIAEMLRKEPADRYSMRQVLSALKGIEASKRARGSVEAVHASPAPRAELGGRWISTDDFD